MTTDTERQTVELEDAIARLEVFQTHVDPCEHGHVDHGPDDHLGRKIVHSLSPKGFGADWDADGAEEFIRGAKRIIETTGMAAATGHHIAAYGQIKLGEWRWMAFAARKAESD